MLSKKVLKDIQSLGLKKYRDETGLFVAEGPKVVEELVQVVPHLVQGIFAVEEWAAGRKEVEVISDVELERISTLKTPNKVLAVLRQTESHEPQTDRFTLYLDTIQDPGNFGTIIRIADWFGVKDVV